MRLYLLIFLISLNVLCAAPLPAAEAPRKIIVPMHNINPIFIFNQNGHHGGISFELLKAIATRENWELEFIQMTMKDLNDYMKYNQDSKVSVLTFLAKNNQRTQYLDFTEKSILDVCSTLITSSSNRLSKISDLNNQKIAVMNSSASAEIFINIINDLDINCEILKLPTYNNVMDYTSDNKGAIGLINNYTFSYYQSLNSKYDNLESTLLILPSFSLRFAVRKGKDQDILQTINHYIGEWKGTADSPYSQIIEQWDSQSFSPVKPGLLSLITFSQLLIIAVILIALVLWILLLRYKIKTNTKKIKAKELDLQATLMSIADGVIVTDAAGIITEINPSAQKMLCLENEMQINKFNTRTDLLLLEQESLTPLLNPIMSTIVTATTQIHKDTCILRNSEGHNFIINYTASPIFVAENLKGVIFVFKDITEEAKNAERIMRSERELSVMLESVNEAIMVFDTSLKLQQVNNYGFKIISDELNTSNILGLSCHDICFAKPDETSSCPAKYTLLTKQRLTKTVETKSGKIFQLKTTPILNDNAEVISIIQCLIDITELKNKEKALRTSEKNYRMLIENQSDLVAKLDSQGIIVFGTQSCMDFMGIPREDFLNKLYLNFIIPEDHEIAIDAINRLKSSEATVSVEVRHKSPDGIHWVSWQLSKVLDENDELEYIIVTGRDITEAKLASEQLQHVQKLEAIGQLAGGIAHDFNNMLGGIVGFAELISMQSGDNKTIAAYSKNIIDTSEKAADLTQQLLTFARKGKSSITPIDVHSAINRAINILKRSIKKNISIELCLQAKNSMIIGDPTQIQNIILNLGINSRDAIGEEKEGLFSIDTTTVTLSEKYCEESDFDIQPQDYILIKARDNGIGMDSDILEHIFEPFFTTKEVGKGTGLGLASIYGTVTAHKGAITATSEYGTGTEFNIFLPVIDKQEAIEEPETSTDLFNFVKIKQSITILVIDDEEIIRLVAKSLLENMGYTVLLASDGQEGIEIFELNQDIISAVILDVIMPRMDGRETLAELQKINPEIKIIMASGFSQADKIDDFILSGAKEFIHKPYRQKELYLALRKILNLE